MHSAFSAHMLCFLLFNLLPRLTQNGGLQVCKSAPRSETLEDEGREVRVGGTGEVTGDKNAAAD